MINKIIFISITSIALFSCSKSSKPKLVVYIVSDQLTPDLLNKFDPLLLVVLGGLKITELTISIPSIIMEKRILVLVTTHYQQAYTPAKAVLLVMIGTIET